MRVLAAILAGALLTMVAACASARPAAEASAEEGDLMVVTGVVRTVGSEPFSEVVITDDDDTDWYVVPDEVDTLQRLEQRRVKVRGILSFQSMTLADGRELPPRRILSDLEVLEVVE